MSRDDLRQKFEEHLKTCKGWGPLVLQVGILVVSIVGGIIGTTAKMQLDQFIKDNEAQDRSIEKQIDISQASSQDRLQLRAALDAVGSRTTALEAALATLNGKLDKIIENQIRADERRQMYEEKRK